MVPDEIIPSIFIFLRRMSTSFTMLSLAIDLIYRSDTLVSVYFPSLYFFIHKSLLLILLLINPILFSMFSVNESKGPRAVFSVVGVVTPRDKSFLVSRAMYFESLIKRMVKPLFKKYDTSS